MREYQKDSLTTASVLTVSENSSDTSARKVLSVVQDHVDGYQSVALDIQSDGGRKGIHLDKNYTNILAATGENKVYGVQVDLDQTAASGTATIDVTGLEVDSLWRWWNECRYKYRCKSYGRWNSRNKVCRYLHRW